MQRRQVLSSALAAALCGGACRGAFAQGFPTRPLRLVVPFPGGTTDSLARIVAQKMGADLGQPLVVENVPGASGNIGAGQVARAAPDGYSLLVVSNSYVTGPLLGVAAAFTPADLAPVGLMATATSVLVTRPDRPFKTLRELIAYAKAHPGKVSYASAGSGTLGHLYGEWFKAEAGIELLHVPYKGGGPALVDVMGGQVDLLFDVLVTTLPQVRANKLRAIAVTAGERSSLLPEVPTMSEAGLPGFAATAWFAMLAPAATPRPVLERLSAALAHALALPETRLDLEALGMLPDSGQPERFRSLFAGETERWGRIIRSANIRAS